MADARKARCFLLYPIALLPVFLAYLARYAFDNQVVFYGILALPRHWAWRFTGWPWNRRCRRRTTGAKPYLPNFRAAMVPWFRNDVKIPAIFLPAHPLVS